MDVGVHQDGLVHVSQLADRYVTDPNQVVQVGQRVKVTVLSTDLPRNRIALYMKTQPSADGVGAPTVRGAAGKGRQRDGGGRAAAPHGTAKPATPRIPRSGEIASNGMRFK